MHRTTPPNSGSLSQGYWIVAKHVNKNNNKMAGKWRALTVKALILSLDALAVAFYCDFKRRKAFDRLGGSPNFETFTWQKLTETKRVTRSGGQKKILQNDIT